jgi:hypothetical protein
MGRVKEALRRVTKWPGVPQTRHLAERTVAPYLRADVHQIALDQSLTGQRLFELTQTVEHLRQLQVPELQAAVRALEVHQPTVLNAIASANGTARLLARETDGLRLLITELSQTIKEASEKTAERLNEIEPAIWAGDQAVRDDFGPHIDTLAWLLTRVETVRAEIMHELRYGPSREAVATEPKIINPGRLNDADIRLNLGAGHIAVDGFVNVDMRELPGIDVVAAIDSLPFEPGTVAEIFSSHTIEHFPEEQLRRKLLPYWIGLLRPGGNFRAIVPDLEAMTKAYSAGDMTFEVLRSVLYGGQEYEGDFHFTGFTPDSMCRLLVESGLEQPMVIAKGRPNGDCLEFEVSALKPSS